jgi:hypothetical protein
MTQESEVTMQLSPEERRKIYEEEKAQIDAEQKRRMTTDGSTPGLGPNVVGSSSFQYFFSLLQNFESKQALLFCGMSRLQQAEFRLG